MHVDPDRRVISYSGTSLILPARSSADASRGGLVHVLVHPSKASRSPVAQRPPRVLGDGDQHSDTRSAQSHYLP
jgi:hypothetical protein